MTGGDDRRCRLASASFGALLTSLTMTPLDVIRVRMQSTTVTGGQGQYVLRPLCPEAGSIEMPCRDGPWSYRISNGALPDHHHDLQWCSRCHQPSYTRVAEQNTFRSVFRLIRGEGVGSLWRGLTPTLAQSIPSTVIYFNAYDELHQTADLTPALAGAVARVGAATLVSPIELIRTRIMAHAGKPESAWALLRNISREVIDECRTSGIRVIYRGLGPTLFRDVPFSALYWTGFESIRSWLRDLISDTTPGSVISVFTAGTISGTIAAICTQPFDVIKTRQQIEHSNSVGRSARHVLNDILHNGGGWTGLFTGLTPRIAKIAPACAIMISSYELGKVLLSRKASSSSST